MPPRPVAATLAAVIHENRVLLIRRAHRPDAGRWAFPGGKIGFGETLSEAARRELLEETGVQGSLVQIFDAVDVFDREARNHEGGDGDSASDGALHRHYILIAAWFDWLAGEPRGGDDALDARWFTESELDSAELARSFDVASVARHALRLAASRRSTEGR